MDSLTVSFDISAILLCIACLALTLIRHQTGKFQNKLFMGLIVIVALGAISNCAYLLLSPITAEKLDAARMVKNIYFIFHTALAPTCFYYMFCVASSLRKYSLKRHFLFLLPFFICEVLVLLNPLTGWTYTLDPVTFEYHRGWVVYLMYGVGMAYLVGGIVVIFKTWNAITPIRRNSLLFYTITVVAGVVVQMLVPQLRIELFAESLGIAGLLFSTEKEDDRIDMETGVYTRQAFLLDFDRYISAKTKFHVVCVNLTNEEFVLRMMGRKNHETLMAEISDWMKDLVPWFRIYRVSPSSFMFMSFESESTDARDLAIKIQKRFSRPWKIRGVDISIHTSIMMGSVPEEFSTGDEMLLMADIPAISGASGEILSGSDLDYLRRSSQVDHAVGRGLEDGNFEMYYQPICSPEGAVYSAEALMRLHDPELGSIPPDEFIKSAEITGAIDQLGTLALEEVCQFLASGRPNNAGVKRIHINLSVVQCLDSDLVDTVVEIVEKYGVNPTQIGFEITESVAAEDDGAITEMMNKLASKGFGFGMDDYGTGYANMHFIFTHDFDAVKVDKSILWDADNADGMTALECTMKMIHETGRKSVVEGVETKEQVELLRKLEADYLQGFYFSKPLPQDEFLSVCEDLRTSTS